MQNPNINTRLPQALAFIRIISGILLIYHGHELLIPDKMNGYTKWLGDLHYPLPALFAYAGKAVELVGGLSLLLGLWVRFCMLPLSATLLLITFTMGHGKIFTDDQHPFILALLCAVFFCTGAGVWSVDAWLQKKRSNKRV